MWVSSANEDDATTESKSAKDAFKLHPLLEAFVVSERASRNLPPLPQPPWPGKERLQLEGSTMPPFLFIYFVRTKTLAQSDPTAPSSLERDGRPVILTDTVVVWKTTYRVVAVIAHRAARASRSGDHGHYISFTTRDNKWFGRSMCHVSKLMAHY